MEQFRLCMDSGLTGWGDGRVRRRGEGRSRKIYGEAGAGWAAGRGGVAEVDGTGTLQWTVTGFGRCVCAGVSATAGGITEADCAGTRQPDEAEAEMLVAFVCGQI